MTQITWFPATGPSVVFARPNYYVTRMSGFAGAPTMTRVLSAPYQHGGTLVDSRQDPRDLRLTVMATASSVNDMRDRRRELVRAFNARLGVGILRVDWPDGESYEIQAEPDESPIADIGRTPHAWEALITLVAPFPNFRDPTEAEILLGEPPNSVAVSNDGDIPAPMEITINGPVERPRIDINDPFVFVRVDDTLADGESVTVITGPGAPIVKFTDANGTVDGRRLITQTSNLSGMVFPLGDSAIGYESDDQATANRGTASVRWRQWWAGI